MRYLIFGNIVLFLSLLYISRKYILLKYGHKTFQRLIEHINVGYYRYRGNDGVILAANNGFLKILELDISLNEVIGQSLTGLLIYIESEDKVREILRERKAIRNYEYRFRTLKGKDKCVLHNSYILRDPYTGEEVIEVLIEDITEERISYEKMKESQERYEKLFKNSGDMVIICRFNEAFVIEEINPVTEIIAGYEAEELLGRKLDDMIHPGRRKSLEHIREELLFNNAVNLETVIVCKDGTYKEVMMTFSVFDFKDDRIVMIVIKDVSAIVGEREEEKRRKKELEDFWKASIEREERIRDLRTELERVQKQLEYFKGKDDRI